MGILQLDCNEQISLANETGSSYEVISKEWGFYATPSINGRMKSYGFKTALVINSKGQRYIMAVIEDRLTDFNEYLSATNQKVEKWLDQL